MKKYLIDFWTLWRLGAAYTLNIYTRANNAGFDRRLKYSQERGTFPLVSMAI